MHCQTFEFSQVWILKPPPPWKKEWPSFCWIKLFAATTHFASLPVFHFLSSSILFSGSDEAPEPTEPLIEVIEDGMYTGQSLDNLIRSLREKLDSNVPAEEFKVCTFTFSQCIISV